MRKLDEEGSHLPIGLISKKCTGVRRMALNMLLCRVWAELTRTLKKTKLRRKPNTTEVAVKPDKGTGKKSISTLQCYPCACSKVSYAFKVPLLSMLNDTKKAYMLHLIFPSIMFFLLLLIYHCEYKVKKSEEAGSHREKNQNNPTAENKKDTAISLYS